jgi:hypothetical protein
VYKRQIDLEFVRGPTEESLSRRTHVDLTVRWIGLLQIDHSWEVFDQCLIAVRERFEFRGTMDDVAQVVESRPEEDALADAYRSGDHFDRAHTPIRKSVGKNETRARALGGLGESCSDLSRRKGVDTIDGERAQNAVGPPVKAHGGIVGVDDTPVLRVDQQLRLATVPERCDEFRNVRAVPGRPVRGECRAGPCLRPPFDILVHRVLQVPGEAVLSLLFSAGSWSG